MGNNATSRRIESVLLEPIKGFKTLAIKKLFSSTLLVHRGFATVAHFITKKCIYETICSFLIVDSVIVGNGNSQKQIDP